MHFVAVLPEQFFMYCFVIKIEILNFKIKTAMLEKIRYRLVYNRQNRLNRQGTALVQIEAYLNQRKSYFKTNIYLKPECWSKDGAQVINHPQSNELNAMLYEKILELQAIELSYWKRNGEESILMLYFHGETTGMI